MGKTVKIAIIDYKMSNMFSIKNALDSLGYASQITSDGQQILSSDGAVLPGVGSFPEAMGQLRDLNLISVIKEFVSSGKPFMGICLGLQLLFTQSEEYGFCEGLGIIDGTVEDFSNYVSVERVPHVGWNKVSMHAPRRKQSAQAASGLDLEDGSYYYFVHSYFVNPTKKEDVFTTTRYGGIEFCSSILKENIFASQFHPEKSGQNGLRLLKQFFC
jgi:glutamine amidotransferase